MFSQARRGWSLRAALLSALILVCASALGGRVEAAGILYATGVRVGPGIGPGGLYQIDPTTGAATFLFELSGFVQGGGLVYDAATDLLYATGYNDKSQSGLWSINRFTGAQTFIGLTGAAVDQYGLALDPVTGIMYASGDNQKQSTAFYKVDKTTGAATFVGQATGQFTRIYGLGFGAGGVLYANGFDDPFTQAASLYTVNPATGASMLVGTTGVTLGRRTSYSGLALGEDGVLFSLGSIDASAIGGLYAMNTLTGAATLIGSTKLAFGVDGGLAFAPDKVSAVPEPELAWLLAASLAPLWVLRRRGHRHTTKVA